MMSRRPVPSRQGRDGPMRHDYSRDSRSPGARHLRACPVRAVIIIAWDPVPARLLREYSRRRACSSHGLWSGGQSGGQSVLLTASLFVAPEPPREARRGTVFRPDYDGYCCVLHVLPHSDERGGGVLPVCVASRVVVTTSSRETSQQRQGARRAEETGR
ncbi:hypothetical protein Taro_042544 [Colocasia esculenta]|uniref:Uncharacterized protein n=1 Tax=Colocasia esculenta TaxID=4460 RepID=A0A843WIQ0_COLES|nr:hypothetical protein [Colocasia esculenta]